MKPCKHPCCSDSGPCKKAKDPQRIQRTAVIQRSPLRQGVGMVEGKTGAKKRLPIKRVSDKRKAQDQIYNQRIRKFKIAHPVCACCQESPTKDVHHMKGRVGNDYLDEKFWLPVCRSCHMEIEQNPVWARAAGYSVSRLNKNI